MSALSLKPSPHSNPRLHSEPDMGTGARTHPSEFYPDPATDQHRLHETRNSTGFGKKRAGVSGSPPGQCGAGPFRGLCARSRCLANAGRIRSIPTSDARSAGCPVRRRRAVREDRQGVRPGPADAATAHTPRDGRCSKTPPSDPGRAACPCKAARRTRARIRRPRGVPPPTLTSGWSTAWSGLDVQGPSVRSFRQKRRHRTFRIGTIPFSNRLPNVSDAGVDSKGGSEFRESLARFSRSPQTLESQRNFRSSLSLLASSFARSGMS